MFEDSGSYYVGPNIEYEILVAQRIDSQKG